MLPFDTELLMMPEVWFVVFVFGVVVVAFLRRLSLVGFIVLAGVAGFVVLGDIWANLFAVLIGLFFFAKIFV